MKETTTTTAKIRPPPSPPQPHPQPEKNLFALNVDFYNVDFHKRRPTTTTTTVGQCSRGGCSRLGVMRRISKPAQHLSEQYLREHPFEALERVGDGLTFFFLQKSYFILGLNSWLRQSVH
jgi:hypothetical protein